jgi:hypothetical protein
MELTKYAIEHLQRFQRSISYLISIFFVIFLITGRIEVMKALKIQNKTNISMRLLIWFCVQLLERVLEFVYHV